jgi:hypothetical protein
MNWLLNWLWSGPESSYEWAVLALLPIALAVFVVRSLWVVASPGEIGASERQRLFGRARFSIFENRWVFQVAVPACLLIGYFFLFLPVSRPITLVLSSRSRLPNQDMGVWKARWENLLERTAATVPSAKLDAGPVVKAVLDDLAEMDRSSWRPGETNASEAIRKSLEKKLASYQINYDPDVRVLKDEYAPKGMERWIIETVELSAIQALMTDHNVHKVVFLGAERPTMLGSCWSQLRTQIERGGRAELAEREPDLLPAPKGLKLLAAYSSIDGAGAKGLTCVVESEGLSTAKRVSGRLSLIDAADKKETVELVVSEMGGIQDGLWARGVAASPGILPTRVQLEFDSQLGSVIDVQAAESTGGNITMHLSVAQPDFWIKSWFVLTREAGVPPEVNEWRKALSRVAPIDSIQFGNRATDSNAVAIDTMITPGLIWVYPAAWSTASSLLPSMVATLSSDESAKSAAAKWVAVAAEGGSGNLGFGGLSLPNGPTGHPKLSGGLIVVDGRPLSPQYTDGINVLLNASTGPFIWREEVATEIAGRPTRRIVTAFAIDPMKTHIFCDSASQMSSPTFERAVILAFWTELVRAVAAASGGNSLREDTARPDHPISVWTDSELVAARGRAVSVQAVPFLLGLFLYSLFLTAATRHLPAFDKSTSQP